MCESTWHPPTALAGPMSCGPRTLGLRILPGAAFANTITTAKHEIAGLLTYLSWQSSRLSSRRAPPNPGMVQPGARVMVVRVQIVQAHIDGTAIGRYVPHCRFLLSHRPPLLNLDSRVFRLRKNMHTLYSSNINHSRLAKRPPRRSHSELHQVEVLYTTSQMPYMADCGGNGLTPYLSFLEFSHDRGRWSLSTQ